MDGNVPDYMVETRGLVKRYGKFTAVDHLDLRVKKGEIYGLLGPNGAGKTTTIKMLCGLLKVSGGEAHVTGKADPRPAHRRGHRVHAPGDRPLSRPHRAPEHDVLRGDIRAVQEGDRGEGAGPAGVHQPAEWRDELVGNLSGGMKHRVSLACALIHEPPLLLLDEPTVGVDPELRVSFWDYFNDIKSQGRTIVITTHYMDEASRCDRIGFMRNGRLIAEGKVGGTAGDDGDG